MTKHYIALLRGINVGGKNVIKMADLRAIFETLKFENVKTYIQSGNVLFDTKQQNVADLSKRVGDAIEEIGGIKCKVFILDVEQLKRAVANLKLPYLKDNMLYFYFLSKTVKDVDLDLLDKWVSQTETYQLTDDVFYIHCPDGVHKSKLAPKIDKILRVETTARNLRSVNKIIELAQL